MGEPVRAAAAEVTVPLIELVGLGKRYGSVVALHPIDATIDGKIIGLLGPNGAGKSTLLKCLLGLIPFDGEARVLGRSAVTRGAEIRDRVGYMPEHDVSFPGSSAIEMCTYVAELSGLPRGEAVQRAHAVLYYAGLEDKRYQPIESYSTGMKQRVKLAQALVHDPDLLFLDEPTNGLDPRSRDEMLELIAQLPERRGCAIVLSTHVLPDIERVCDRAIIMHGGKLRFSGAIDELRGVRDRGPEVVVSVKADAARLHEALRAEGATCDLLSPVAVGVQLAGAITTQHVFRTALAAGLQIRGVDTPREPIETAFLRVIGEAPAS